MEKIHLPADKNIHKIVRLHLYRDIGKSVKREVVQYQQKPPPSGPTKQQNEPMNQCNGPNINRDHLHQTQPEQMETTFQSTNTIRDLSRGL